MIEDPDDIVPDDLDLVPETIARDSDIATPDNNPEEPYDDHIERIARSVDRVLGWEE